LDPLGLDTCCGDGLRGAEPHSSARTPIDKHRAVHLLKRRKRGTWGTVMLAEGLAPPFRRHNVMAKWERSGTHVRASVMSVAVTAFDTREARVRKAVGGVCAPAGYNAAPCDRWVREPGSGT